MGRRTSRRHFYPISCLILLAAFAAAAGCSSSPSSQPAGGSSPTASHVLPSGGSVTGWLVLPSGGTHASSATLDYLADNAVTSCAECHGSDLTGGVSKVSCFGNPAGCHLGPVANWASPSAHGASAKNAPGNSGFASCQICHGSGFSGGGANRSCFACHGVSAPHPPKPWRSAHGVGAHGYGRYQRPGLRAVPLPGIAEQPARPPVHAEAIRDGFKTLFEIGAVDQRREQTPIGRQLARLPVDPRVGRMVLAAAEENCLHEVLIIASALEIQDPRERPHDKQQQADERQAQFLHEDSDFLSYLKLWDFYHHLRESVSRSKLRRACQQLSLVQPTARMDRNPSAVA